MNTDLIKQIIEADISRPTKEKILSYWLLPPEDNTSLAPIQKVSVDQKGGVVHRPTKEQLDLKANPRKAEEIAEMEETLDEVMGETE